MSSRLGLGRWESSRQRRFPSDQFYLILLVWCVSEAKCNYSLLLLLLLRYSLSLVNNITSLVRIDYCKNKKQRQTAFTFDFWLSWTHGMGRTARLTRFCRRSRRATAHDQVLRMPTALVNEVTRENWKKNKLGRESERGYEYRLLMIGRRERVVSFHRWRWWRERQTEEIPNYHGRILADRLRWTMI